MHRHEHLPSLLQSRRPVHTTQFHLGGWQLLSTHLSAMDHSEASTSGSPTLDCIHSAGQNEGAKGSRPPGSSNRLLPSSCLRVLYPSHAAEMQIELGGLRHPQLTPQYARHAKPFCVRAVCRDGSPQCSHSLRCLPKWSFYVYLTTWRPSLPLGDHSKNLRFPLS